VNKKINNCLEKIEKKGFQALLISNPTNISYLSNFRKADGYLLISRNAIIYFTNFIYAQEARRIKNWRIKLSNTNIFDTVVKEIFKLKLKSICFEAKHLSYLEYKKLKEIHLKRRIKFSPVRDIVEGLRTIKDKKEISFLKNAIDVTLEAFTFIDEIANDNMSEKDLYIEIERFLKIKSDNELAFLPIVAFGKNTAFPHHLPSQVKLSKSKLFLIDLGARHCGYCADLTRVFFLGKMPTYLKKVYDVVKKAKDLAIKKIREGVRVKDVDKAARAFIEKKGFGKYFGHGLGHGIGMSVHEEPYINYKNDNILKEGMVVTIEPAIYLPGRFGIRIEDMVLVKSKRGEILSGYIHQ